MISGISILLTLLLFPYLVPTFSDLAHLSLGAVLCVLTKKNFILPLHPFQSRY